MGQMSTEQTTAIIDSVAGVIDAVNPDTTNVIVDTNYWWLAIIAILPLIAGGIWAWFRKKNKP